MALLLQHSELIAALAYPLAVALSALFAQRLAAPTVAPATTTELKELVLANARLLHATGTGQGLKKCRIAIFGSPPTTARPTTLFTCLQSRRKQIFSAAVVDMGTDEQTERRIIMEGPDRQSLGEALDSLLAVTAAVLGERFGIVCEVDEDGGAALDGVGLDKKQQ